MNTDGGGGSRKRNLVIYLCFNLDGNTFRGQPSWMWSAQVSHVKDLSPNIQLLRGGGAFKTWVIREVCGSLEPSL